MELTEGWFLSEILNLLLCVLVLLTISCVAYLLVNRNNGKRSADGIGTFALTVTAFAILGFVTGKIMSDSREPSVSAVLPATLTLMGGIIAYLVGTQGPNVQVLASALLFNFSLSLFVCTDYGGAIRDEVTDTQAIDSEQAQLGAEAMRLSDYVKILQLKHDFEEKNKPKYNLDLSKFSSSYEREIRPDLSKAEGSAEKK
jgi:hypothetical protein